MENIKNQAISIIKALPDNCNWEDIQYNIYVCEKIAKGMQAADDCETVTQLSAEKEVEGWLQSFGPNQH